MTPRQILTLVLLLVSLVGVPQILDSLAAGETADIGPTEPSREAVEAAATRSARVRQAEELLKWGRQRYSDEGMQLPDTILVVQPSLAQCNGRVGRYNERTNELVLCRIDQETVLHELAHAWIGHNLDDAGRDRFVELRGLDEWNDRSQEWAERGAEQAAEILVWALSDQDHTVRWVEECVESRRLLSIDDSTPTSLAAAFELMVGRKPTKRTIETTKTEAFSPEAQRAPAATVATPFSWRSCE